MKLRSVAIDNFRSIRGIVECDLNASVVLVHGANGAGKTSFLSAIELGLTGTVSALAGFGAQHAHHLLHSGASTGSVQLSIEDDGAEKSTTIRLEPAPFVPEPLLDPRDRVFLRERGYLAQSTMARLLEAYEESDRRGDSALTRFVNELLGLETLDALIAGLEPARDIRRIRKLVPEFADLESELSLLRKRSRETQAAISKVTREHADLRARLSSVGGDRGQDVPSLGPTSSLLARVEALDAQYQELRGTESVDFIDLEGQLNSVIRRIEMWRATSLAACEALLGEAVAFAGAEVELSADAGAVDKSMGIAEGLVSERLTGLNARLSADRAGRAKLAPLQERIDAARAEAARINEEIANVAISSDVAGLAEALSTVSTYVRDDDDVCPVCGRDYGELHSGTLSAHLTERISLFGTLAKRLSTLGERRAKLQAHLDGLVREKQTIQIGLESEEAVEVLTANVVIGNDLVARIGGARPSTAGAAHDHTERSRLEAVLSSSQAAAEQLARLRRELASIGFDAGFGSRQGVTHSLREQLDEMRERVLSAHRVAVAAVRDYEARNTVASAADERARELAGLREADASLRKRIAVAASRLVGAKQRVESAANLSKDAVELRTKIVEQVFDSTLNGTWRDLFTRLAPEEPYIPEFVGSSGPGSGVSLRAVNKRTGMAGPPGLVLSAGNLNTAALTLFLSLNATATTTVELLLLDDPVQAMDDIHVAQFSALLRSFARDLNRQVVIAVHERSLFEYLALELAPSNVGEALVTIELSRVPDQISESTVTRVEYHPDPLEAGLSAA